jgi:hypothetical protein
VRKIPRPVDTTLATYNSCISGVSDATEKASYVAIASEIDAAGRAFETAVTGLTLHSLAVARPTAAAVSDKELTDVYTAGLVGRIAGRPVYDRLLASAPGGICPICGVGDASTLDHYAPKSKHPMLSVVPINLLPACLDCNHTKSAGLPTSPGEHTLHPYFDDVDDHVWLVATVQRTTPASFTFAVAPPLPPVWSATLADRVRHHFACFKLGKRFAIRAADELVSTRHNLEELHKAGGAAQVQAHLVLQAASFSAARRNSWRAAMYTAASSDAWFLSGGFR